DREVRCSVEQLYALAGGRVIRVARQIDGVPEWRNLREDVERKRQISDRVEKPGEEILRKQNEREDLLRRALASEVREDDDAECAAEDRCDKKGGHDPGELIERQRDPQDDGECKDAGCLRKRDE